MHFMDSSTSFFASKRKSLPPGRKPHILGSMPRKNPLPKREIEICKRLREYRESSTFSQERFARATGVEMSLLSTYENCRAPVRYDVARQIAVVFGMSEPWLAEGIGAMFTMREFAPERPSSIPPHMAFSKAYDTYLKAFAVKESAFLKSVDALYSGKGGPATMGIYDRLRRTFVAQVADELREAPVIALRDYYQGWKVLVESVQRKHRKKPDPARQ